MPRPPVLVVDDDDDIRSALAELIRADGFPVLTAANGQEALHLLASSPRPGIILLDLMMPVMNGSEFMSAQRSNRNYRDIPVVILTANSYRSEAMMIGVADILLKPIQPATLLASIEKHCLRSSPRLDAPSAGAQLEQKA